jgi:hypothetical protein
MANAVLQNVIDDIRRNEGCDEVTKPAHYTFGEIEHIDVAEQLAKDGADFRVLYALKYLWRYNRKGDPVQDLKKAVQFLNRLIAELEAA